MCFLPSRGGGLGLRSIVVNTSEVRLVGVGEVFRWAVGLVAVVTMSCGGVNLIGAGRVFTETVGNN